MDQEEIDVEKAATGTRCIVGRKIEGLKDLATHPEEKEAKRVDMCPYTRTLPERTLDVYSLAAARGPHRCSPSLMAHANLAAET